MAASNTKDCFRESIGKRIVGVLFVDRGNTLVFDDGTGLTFASNGSFWQESANQIAKTVCKKKDELANIRREIDEVLALAGVKNKRKK